jgi:hypothetical protein
MGISVYQELNGEVVNPCTKNISHFYTFEELNTALEISMNIHSQRSNNGYCLHNDITQQQWNVCLVSKILLNLYSPLNYNISLVTKNRLLKVDKEECWQPK